MTERAAGASWCSASRRWRSDIVTAHGGRVIKTVGDEVLFVDDRRRAGRGRSRSTWSRRWPRTTCCPTCGSAWPSGRSCRRLGDVFGTTVNRASRLTAVAPAGRRAGRRRARRVAGRLSGFEMTALRRRTLRGIGQVTPCELRRARRRRSPSGGSDDPRR